MTAFVPTLHLNALSSKAELSNKSLLGNKLDATLREAGCYPRHLGRLRQEKDGLGPGV